MLPKNQPFSEAGTLLNMTFEKVIPQMWLTRNVENIDSHTYPPSCVISQHLTLGLPKCKKQTWRSREDRYGQDSCL